jgi:hypothetical protein
MIGLRRMLEEEKGGSSSSSSSSSSAEVWGEEGVGVLRERRVCVCYDNIC